MSIECGECERDLRGGHAPFCSRYIRPAVVAHIEALEAERDKLLWLIGGLCAAIDTGRNEPLRIWREQADIAGVAPNRRAALKGEGE